VYDGSKLLLDSAVATMKIKDIPPPANKLVYPKSFIYADTELTIYSKYVIENVGYSLHYDILNPNEPHKEFNFSYK